jgi:hypothetical protein
MKELGIYTMSDWEKDHVLKIKNGQRVSNEVVWELINGVPPTTYRNNLFQNGEPHDDDIYGNPLYDTFIKEGEYWVYCGHCRKGEIIHTKGYYEHLSESESLFNSALDYIEFYWARTGRPPGFDGWFKDHQNLTEEEAKDIWDKAMKKISTYFI